MRRLKFSIVELSIILAVLAIDLAVVRSLARTTSPGSNQPLYMVPIDATHALPFLTIALGVLPMASLLVPAAIFQALKIRRTGVASPARQGFVTFGWLALFLFMALASLSPPGLQRYLLGIGEWIGPAINRYIGDDPVSPGTWMYWFVQSIEGAICIVAFSLPQLAAALAGGLFIGRTRAGVLKPMILRETPTQQMFPREAAAA